jgi:hypothetical protein
MGAKQLDGKCGWGGARGRKGGSGESGERLLPGRAPHRFDLEDSGYMLNGFPFSFPGWEVRAS